MKIRTYTINYYNDNGEPVSKEEFEKDYSKFIKEVDDAYNEKVNQLIKSINSDPANDAVKLWLVFDFLTNNNMEYLLNRTLDGKNANAIRYSFGNYKTFTVGQETKYPAILNNSGVCKTFALAFEDISNRLGIPCRVVIGNTGMEHAWNIVYVNNEFKQIDVAYAIMNRRINDKRDYFLKDSFSGRTVQSDIVAIEKEMKDEYDNNHPKITIHKK